MDQDQILEQYEYVEVEYETNNTMCSYSFKNVMGQEFHQFANVELMKYTLRLNRITGIFRISGGTSINFNDLRYVFTERYPDKPPLERKCEYKFISRKTVPISSVYNKDYQTYASAKSTISWILSILFNTFDVIFKDVADISRLLKFAIEFIESSKWKLILITEQNRNNIQHRLRELYAQHTIGKYDGNFLKNFSSLIEFVSHVSAYLKSIPDTIKNCKKDPASYDDCALLIKISQLSTFFDTKRNFLAKKVLEHVVQKCKNDQELGCADENKVMDQIIAPFMKNVVPPFVTLNFPHNLDDILENAKNL